MNWSTDDERTTTVDDLNEFDIGHRIRFRRPASVTYGAPEIHGKLLRVGREDYWRGNILRHGYTIVVGFPSKFGGFNQDTFAPIPGNFPVWVGPKWIDRKTTHEIEMEERFDTPESE